VPTEKKTITSDNLVPWIVLCYFATGNNECLPWCPNLAASGRACQRDLRASLAHEYQRGAGDNDGNSCEVGNSNRVMLLSGSGDWPDIDDLRLCCEREMTQDQSGEAGDDEDQAR
jgi:hypothetical protein